MKLHMLNMLNCLLLTVCDGHLHMHGNGATQVFKPRLVLKCPNAAQLIQPGKLQRQLLLP
uniref:Anti-inflammatory peptide amregulin n=1 Tax=Amblyomma variegatum TaxID=34610 RepID=AIP_AMBVA|nr:RecName: Full=Anti-inflammatory peptide amregulin; AltName: Full=Hypothetical secreted peptide 866; Flags: Precursor [Amblyomma variegatum]DAA34740.1 TPA_inf: hypothetical secreted peptide precursor 866 [Amblyomma variegatum]